MNSQKRKQFSISEKLEIIAEVDRGVKKSDVALKRGISASTLSTFLKNRSKLESQKQSALLGSHRKKIRFSNFQDVDAAVFTWFQDIRSRNIPVSGPLIREKALEFARAFGYENFQASVGWLNRFKERYGISAKQICGEANSVDLKQVNDWRTGEIAEVIKSYDASDVFNADEAGIFFQLLPNKTLTFKNDKCIGGKNSKQRLTALFCCNMSGTEKRKVLVIGKSAKPRCLKNVNSLPCDYRSSRKAWMTTGIFNEWLVKFDEEMKRNKRRILLLIDNCSPHNETPKLECIRIEYFPPNCTSILQPLDQCVIKVVKGKYRTHVLRRMLLQIDNKESILKPDVKQAMEMIAGAWKEISQNVICSGWKKANLTFSETDEINVNSNEDCEFKDLQSVWEHVSEVTSVPNGISFQDFLTADDETVTCESLSDDDIVRKIQESKESSLPDSSDDEEIPEECFVSVPSASEALSSLETLKRYLSVQKNVSDTLFENVYNLEKFVLSGANNFVQKEITDYMYLFPNK